MVSIPLLDQQATAGDSVRLPGPTASAHGPRWASSAEIATAAPRAAHGDQGGHARRREPQRLAARRQPHPQQGM